MKIPKKFSEILFLVEISKGSRNARSGFLDADSLLIQAEMFMQPDAFKRFKHFYDRQVRFFYKIIDSPKVRGLKGDFTIKTANNGYIIVNLVIKHRPFSVKNLKISDF